MKKIYFYLSVLILCITFQNCSSVKVLDSWKSNDIENIKDNSFLVVARTNNNQARIAFENEIVKQMESNGYKATSSFSKFGSMKPNDPKTEANQNKLREILKDEGFTGVVLTVMKDYQEETRVQKDGGYYAGSGYYSYYPRYYGGFYGYFYHPMAYYSPGTYVEETVTTSTSKIYILETTIYNLEKEADNQLVAVVTSQIDNPQTASVAAEQYVKKVAASLK